ncbi:hypothetical protein [uncultured Modestobacter sp.]|uniref:hypothetical protein n=1 Tax=uncultured Modestobacter sp. TaxID=380048 RepID=UPI00262390CB|nr:hypothetical protein [uncultured Modestobacter sp.]
MQVRTLVSLLVLAGAGLTGCTAGAAERVAVSSSAPPAAPTPVPAPSEPTPSPDERPIPVQQDAGYADAVATFGEERVRALLLDDARIARIALADCLRWTTGELHPELTALVSPELLDRVQQELDRPDDGPPPSLLSDLPEDDGNGNDEAAAVVDGCDDSAPLRY